jgi:biopolymer transport protein ExbD
MKYKSHRSNVSADPDMTPMIDMTFQLIAFFMVLMNFSEAEQNERIKLPASLLAKPPEGPVEFPLTMQLTKEGTVLFGAMEQRVEDLAAALSRERRVLELRGDSPTNATVIIRADADAKTGRVQELIEICQRSGFEKFTLRAKQEEAGR